MACATQTQFRRGTAAENAAFTGVEGEVTYGTDSHRLYTHDGVVVGGFPLALLSDVCCPPFVDTTSLVMGSGDNTKQLRFEIDGFTAGATRVLTPPDANINLAGTNISNAWADGVTQTFNPDGTNSGLNVGSHTADPSALNNGDIFYESTVNELRARINGVTVSLGAAGSSPPFVDTTAIVKGSVDATKLLRFEVDGFTAATTRVLTPPNADITIAGTNFLNAWADGITQTFNPDGTNSGINVGANAVDPSALNNGDIWYESTANELRARINGVTVALGASVSPPFVDTQTIIKGSADATKLLRFEVDGFTTGTTRVLTPPNADITIAGINIAQTFTAEQTFSLGTDVSSGQAYEYNGLDVITAITGSFDYFFGGAGNLAMAGSNNLGVGLSALASTTGGSQNTAVGNFALNLNTTGSFNTAVGLSALSSNTTSSGSVAVGQSALLSSTGAQNIAVGFQAGDNITTGAKNIILGYDIDAPVATGSNQLSLGNIIFGTGLTGTGTTIAGLIGIGVNTPTAALHLKAGTAAANNGPLKFTAGTLLATPELGSMEFVDNGTTGHLYITANVAGVLTRLQLDQQTGSSPPFVDTQTIIKGSADATKLLRFEVDGFTTATTRVLTPPNQDATIAGLEVAQTFTAKQTFTPPANTEAIVVTGFSLTGANAQSMFDLAGTWNTSGNPTALKLNITNTASGASSLLQDLQVGSVSQWSVSKAGNVTALGSITGGNALFLVEATTGVVQLSNGTDPGANPTNAIKQWAVSGEWQYRTSASSEGAGQTNRVHNRAESVTGAGTNYTLTTTLARIDFGTTDPEITVPTAGTYLIMGHVQFVSNVASTNDFHFARLRNSTDSVDVGTFVAVSLGSSAWGRVTLTSIVTVSASKTFQLWAANGIAARGEVQSDYTSIKYVRLY